MKSIKVDLRDIYLIEAALEHELQERAKIFSAHLNRNPDHIHLAIEEIGRIKRLIQGVKIYIHNIAIEEDENGIQC